MIPVIFDLDGTLIDSLPNITDAVNALLSEEGCSLVTVAKTVSYVGRGERVLLERLIADTDLSEENIATLMPRFMEHYRQASRETKLMPGAGQAVDTIKRSGRQTGLCTNKPRAALIPTLNSAGLGQAFDVVVAGDDLPVRKPNPEPLLHAVQRLDFEKCIYVGDSEVDSETARRANMPFIFYTQGIRTHSISEIPHDRAFSDFEELPKICDELS